VRYQIVDLSGVDATDIEIPTLRYIAELDRQAANKNPGLKIAVIVKPGTLEEFADVWQNFNRCPNLQTKICLDMATARSWIAQTDLEFIGV